MKSLMALIFPAIEIAAFAAIQAAATYGYTKSSYYKHALDMQVEHRYYTPDSATRLKPTIVNIPRNGLRARGRLGVERKFIDLNRNAIAMSNSWTTKNPTGAKCLVIPLQGIGESQRIGRLFYLHSLHLRGTVIFKNLILATFPYSETVCRVMIVHDTQTNQTQMLAPDCMDDTGTVKYNAFRNLKFAKRFNVLYSKTFIFKGDGLNEGNSMAQNNASGAKQIHFEFNKKWKNPMKCICIGTTGTISDITDNSVHFICVTESTNTIVKYQVRGRFTD